MDDLVQERYERIRETVWDVDEGDDNDDALHRLTPLDRAIYVTRELEEELSDGGWYLVFANEDDHLLGPAITAYELLCLPAYADHLREVIASRFDDASPESDGEDLDEAFRALSGSEAARATAVRAALL